MKNVQGCATIPISSLTDIPNDKIRWWHIYHNDHECVRKILLSIRSTFTNDDTTLMKSGSIVETLAYDLLLEAAMRAQHFYARNLVIEGPWKWILTEFADYYGVSESYTKLRYLSYIMNVATPTKDCLELLHELLVPVLKVRSERTLTRQEYIHGLAARGVHIYIGQDQHFRMLASFFFWSLGKTELILVKLYLPSFFCLLFCGLSILSY